MKTLDSHDAGAPILPAAAAPHTARAVRASQRLASLTRAITALESAPEVLRPDNALRAIELVRMAVVCTEALTRARRVLSEVRGQRPAEVSALMAFASVVDVLEMNVDCLAQTLVPLEAVLRPSGLA